MDLDATAERLQRRVYAQVVANPAGAPQVVGTSVRRVRPAAIRAGSVSMDPSSWTRRRLGRLAGTLPPHLTVAEHDARAYERRVDSFRKRGIEVAEVEGRWLRRTVKGKFVQIETESELVQRRVRHGERQALASTRALARRKGLTPPPARGRPNWRALDPSLYAAYAKRVAMEASRVAHDALVDAYRDAAFDRAEQLRIGWVRECQKNACGACLALADGTVHPYTDRRFYRHTRCRCKPRPARGRKLPRTGQQIFDSSSRAEQDRLFHGRGGAAKAEALRSGRIQLSDLVQIAADRTEWTDYVVGETPLEGLPAAHLDGPGGP